MRNGQFLIVVACVMIALAGCSGGQTATDRSVTPTDRPEDGISTPTPSSSQTATESARESVTLADINKGISASNTTAEVLVHSYISENISDQHVSALYTVFDDVLENGTELTEQITTADGEIRGEYLHDEYRTNGSSTEISQGAILTDIIDIERIIADIDDENRHPTTLQQDIARVEEWYEGEYAEEIATALAEERLKASVTNVSVNGSGGNFSVHGTVYDGTEAFRSQVQVRDNKIREVKRNFTAVLETLEIVRTANRTQDGNRTVDLTERFFSELEAGQFDSIRDAEEIGRVYESVSATSGGTVTAESMIGGYLQNETTARELEYLTQVTSENTTGLVTVTAAPLSDDWSGDGVDNIALMDLGMNPLEDHEILSDYEINRTQTGESATNNTYLVQEAGDGSGFTATVDSQQLSRLGPALRSVSDEFQNPSGAVDPVLFDHSLTRQEQMTNVTDFALRYLDNETHADTVVDMVAIAVVDARDTAVREAGMAERITYFNTFDEAWSDRDAAFQFARLMVDEESLEYPNEAGIQLHDPIFSQAMENGFFSYEHAERLDKTRLENLKEETDGYGAELEEPDVEPDELERLDDDGGGSSSGSSSGDDFEEPPSGQWG